jgi:hypothetical protein
MDATPVPCGTSAVTANRPAPGTAVATDKGLHNWLIGAPVKRSLIAYDHV